MTGGKSYSWGKQALPRQRSGDTDLTNVAIVPAYNESDHVGDVIDGLSATGVVDEVIVVDDASEDETARRAASAGASVLRNEINRQTGGAIKRGYDEALKRGADVVYRLDADGQHDPDDIYHFRDAVVEDDYRYVLGNRFADDEYLDSMPLDRVIGNRIISAWVSLRMWNRVSDPACGYRAIDASFLRQMPYSQFSDDFRMDIEEILFANRLGSELHEVPIECIYGDETSSLSYVAGTKMLFSNVATVNWSRDGKPAERADD